MYKAAAFVNRNPIDLATPLPWNSILPAEISIDAPEQTVGLNRSDI